MEHRRRVRRVGVTSVVTLILVGIMPAWAMTESRQAVCEEAAGGAFRDVAASSTHAANIDCVAGVGIARGVGDRDYAPARTVTRAQMATFLVQLIEVAGGHTVDPTPGSAPFADIIGNVHERSIRVAAHLGVTSGRTDVSFDPLAPVTRGQMATFVVQALEVAGADLGVGAADSFDDDDGTIHERNIDTLAAIEVINGVDDRQYAPRGHVTRAQMATFLINAAAYLHKHDLWAPLEDVSTPPRMLSATPTSADATSSIDVRWNRGIELVGGPTDFLIFDADDATQVATGTTAGAEGHTVTLELDVAMVAGTTYHLRVAEGAVVDARDLLNVAQSVMFVLPADPVADDPDGDGSDDEPVGPEDPDDAAEEVVEDEEVGAIEASAIEVKWLRVDGVPIENGNTHPSDSDSPELTGLASADSGYVSSVEYRQEPTLEWTTATADSGAFTDDLEYFTIPAALLESGESTFHVRAWALDGGISNIYTITVVVDEHAADTEPGIASAYADPGSNRIVVQFTEDVLCPTSSTAHAAWYFTDLGDGSASGSPVGVTQPSADASVCYLYLPLVEGDSGILSYTQPGSLSARVTLAQSGGYLPSLDSVPVPAGS